MPDGRRNNGGARNNAGRPRKAQELEMQTLMLEAWPMDRRRKAIGNLANIAESERKDAVAAFQMLSAYTYGKPIDRKEISGPDGEPLKAYVSVDPNEWDTPSDAAD